MLKRVPVPGSVSSKKLRSQAVTESDYDLPDESASVKIPKRVRRKRAKQTVASPPPAPTITPPRSRRPTPPPCPDSAATSESVAFPILDTKETNRNVFPAPPPAHAEPHTPPVAPLASPGTVAESHLTLASLLDRDASIDPEKVALHWLASLLVHILLIFPLLFLYVHQVNPDMVEIISQPGLTEDLAITEVDDPGPESVPETDLATEIAVSENVDLEAVEPVTFFDDLSSSMRTMPDMSAVAPVPLSEPSMPRGIGVGSEFSGRGKNRGQLVASGGGSEGSEKAVALALAWLAEHQQRDGSWTFDNTHCYACRGQCRNSGHLSQAAFAATGLALLPFLAAGHTPGEGKYKKVVRDGLRFLLQNGRRTENGLSFIDDGQMYSHGICTMVLCEAHAMTSSSGRTKVGDLTGAAIAALRFTEYAQDPVGGGWRYQPRQAGDTSVLGWQVMAIKSGQYGQLTKSTTCFERATSFLTNVVGSENGTSYGYVSRGSGVTNATNAIGLLCRIMLDWKMTNPNLLAGARLLLERGPDFSDPYYNYYATQLFHHIGGDLWRQWNKATRDPLIAQQSTTGHERGSWYPASPNPHCSSGGRLYATALNCLTLEVYYRHLPLYQMQTSEPTEFPVPAENELPQP
ncbi:MAG: hypothetical protein Q4G68_14700 [Planctomycetia bacterium]|nr:hypothetical protein [Planctomycetia bacterium]